MFVLEYAAGHQCGIGQAMPHHDWNCGGGSADDADDHAPGCPQLRLVTSLVYLNTVPEGWGGGTRLPRANVRSKATRGACLLWYNAKDDGAGLFKDPLAQHHGECVKAPDAATEAALKINRFAKFVLVQWIRAEALDDAEDSMSCDEDPQSCEATRALKAAVAAEEAKGEL